MAWAGAGQVAWALVGVSCLDFLPTESQPPVHVPYPEAGLVRDALPAAGSVHAPFSSAWQSLEGDLFPLEEHLFADAADGRWDRHSLLGAALVASGVVDGETLSRYEIRAERLAAELEQSGKITGSPRKRAQALLELMHERILRGGYQIDATDLTVVLDDGRFNCVSASVLFNCLATRFGLVARGLEIPGHAMSRLVLPDGPLDVETTCPAWFRLMGDPEKQAALVEKTLGLRAGERNASAKPREVTDVELVATIYYNRGVDLLAEKRFAEAVAANAKALRLDPSSTTAQGNLLATINNWAVDLGTQGRYVEAIALLRQGLALDPGYDTFRVNYVHVHSEWINELCRLERFRDALDVIARAETDGVDEAYFARARAEVDQQRAAARPEAVLHGLPASSGTRPGGAVPGFSAN